jgi:nitroimidazol reductase NimA-like FMN-containing flavoprotein (pyridoxamine 5'-phosphate oxidase superfamily)
MSLAMSRAEREAFLAEVHVGVIGVADHGRAPLAVPIWYGYEPGAEVWVVTGERSRKANLLRSAQRFSLCVQTEAPPYKYVTIEGPIVSIAPADVERHIRPLAHRYLGQKLGDRYVAAAHGEGSEEPSILVRMRPERWLSADFAKAYGSP